MRTEPIVSRARTRVPLPSTDHQPEYEPSRLALVIADAPLGRVLGALYRAYGYEVVVPKTPLDAVQALLATDRVAIVIVSQSAGWAAGLRELIAEEFPEIDQIVLVA
jgi:hypothetical protein